MLSMIDAWGSEAEGLEENLIRTGFFFLLTP
jgi:hypothetical protein